MTGEITVYCFYQTLSIYHCFQGGPNPGVKKAMTTKEINIEDGRDEEPALQHRPDQLKLAHSQSVGIRVIGQEQTRVGPLPYQQEGGGEKAGKLD